MIIETAICRSLSSWRQTLLYAPAASIIFNFTGTISVFDREDQLLGSFSAPGTSSLALDNSALFLGVTDEQPIISKLEFKSSVPNSAIGLNQLSLVTRKDTNTTDIPEPSSLVAVSVLLAFGYQRRRKLFNKHERMT